MLVMSNLDAIAKKLQQQAKQEPQKPISTPETRRAKEKKQMDCPQCGNHSIMKGFCMVCGYETKE